MRFLLPALAAVAAATPAVAADLTKGTPPVKSISALAFGPGGVLFIGDSQSAAVFAVATGDTKPAGKDDVSVQKLDEKAAGMLGTSPDNVTVNDVKVNPASGAVYVAVTRKGASGGPVVLRVGRDGKMTEFPLKDVPFAKAALPDAGEKGGSIGITSLGFVDGKVIVAAMSTAEFQSTLRAIKYPFDGTTKPTSVEIFHGAHGKLETRSPVQTFVPLKVGDKEEVIAAYTCTPLVRFPVDDLQPGSKVKGTTIAELGNRNKPLDMIAYTKGGKDYILIANSARGVMKVPADGLAGVEPITAPVTGGKTAGAKYETVKELEGVLQLDKLDADRALLLVKGPDGLSLRTIPLP